MFFIIIPYIRELYLDKCCCTDTGTLASTQLSLQFYSSYRILYKHIMSGTIASGDEQQERQQEHDQEGVTKLQVLLVAIATNSTSSNNHEQDKTNINHDANDNINASDNSSVNAEAGANANRVANSSCIPSQMPIDVTRPKEPLLQVHNDATANYNAIPIANANDSSANDPITPTATPTATRVHKSPPPAPHPQSITLDDSRFDMNEMAFSLGPKIQIQKEEQEQELSSQQQEQQQKHSHLPNHAHVLPLTFRNMANNLNQQPYNSQCHSRTHENRTREPQLQSTHYSSDAMTQESTFVPASATTTTSRTNIFSLPLDALHSIATFITVDEWRNFGITNREASLACRDVFQKAKMHAFNCAVEVVTTWVSQISIQ